jgi:hypothetical protein
MPEAEIPSMMLAMSLSKPLTALEPKRVPVPQAKAGELLLKLEACRGRQFWFHNALPTASISSVVCRIQNSMHLKYT